MKTLKTFLIESINIFEGGSSGHMKHPFDYSEFTLQDLLDLIANLFDGKIEDITEKVDGMNIQATKNKNNEVVFIRNKGDLNSENGGMSITDMAIKWKDKPNVMNTFISAGKTIEQVFKNIPLDFFCPDVDTRIYVNCECVIAGQTNIMPYATDQVDFHNLWVYKYDESKKEWINTDVTKKNIEILNKASQGTNAKITPRVIINITDKSNELKQKYQKTIVDIFNNIGLRDSNSTIEDYKRKAYNIYINDNYSWILENPQGANILYDRWVNYNKSINIRQIKGIYQDHQDELVLLDKGEYKKIIEYIMKDLDDYFLSLGNDIIQICKGFINDDNKEMVIKKLTSDLNDTIKTIKQQGSEQAQEKLTKQLNRLNNLGNNINSAEGIVFSYKNKLMKLTGGFAPLNQILGSIKYSM